MATWIYTLPKNETPAAGGGGRRHSTVRDRSATYLATRTTDAIPTAKPHSSSFMYIRPSTYSEARRTAISRRLFLAQNFRASVILSRSETEGTITSTVSTTEMAEKLMEDPTSETSNLNTPLDSSELPSPRSANSGLLSPGASEPVVTCTTSVTNLEISPPFPNDTFPIDLDGEDCSLKEPSIPINLIATNDNSAIAITCAPHSYTSPELVSPISSTCGSPHENWAFRCGSIGTCESPVPLSPRSIDEEDWESIIDDTVSRLTSQCAVSRNAESVLKHSASVDWINITSGSVLRNSVSCSSIDSTGSVDDDRNVPCIFNDYCNPKHDQPSNEGETPVSYADLYKSQSELLSKSTASLLSLSCDLSIKRDDLFNNNNGNGTSSAKSLEGFGCEGKCYLIGEDAVLFVVDGKSKLKAATMDRMVQRLTCDMHNDPEFTSTFLLTYRLFCEGWKMFYALRQRYEATSNYMVKCRVCGVLKQWLEKYYSDFLRKGSFSGTLMEELSSFLEVVKLDHPSAATQLAKLMERKGTVRALTVVVRSPVPNRPRAKATRFTDFDDLEIARQLALIEFEWFKQIAPTECLNKSWVEAKQNAPNICNMINKSNTIPFWVATEIVQCDTVDGRVSLLKKFISIAEHCRSLSNYNGLMEILSGLNMTAIYRLKKTWASLSPRVLNTFQSLNQLMSPDANFKVYRELLRKDTQPRVPYLGRYLTDLVFTEDAMPSYTQSSLIHFWKCKSITQIVLDLVSHQQQSYMFETVPEIQNYLMNCKGLTENALLKLSRKLEPKAS